MLSLSRRRGDAFRTSTSLHRHLLGPPQNDDTDGTTANRKDHLVTSYSRKQFHKAFVATTTAVATTSRVDRVWEINIS